MDYPQVLDIIKVLKEIKEAIENLNEPQSNNMPTTLNPSEAVYGFAAWLTTREEKTVMSAVDNSAPIANLVIQFCEENNLSEVSKQWPSNLIHPTEAAYKQETVRRAFNVIKAAMIADCPSERGSYAHSWHCNIAMMCYDAICAAKKIPEATADDTQAHLDILAISNDAASRFMKLCFDADTKN